MKMALRLGCVCVCVEFYFLICFLLLLKICPNYHKAFLLIQITQVLERRLQRSFLLQYPELFMLPSSAFMLPSLLYYAVIVFAVFPKMSFVTLEDLPLFQNLFSLYDPS